MKHQKGEKLAKLKWKKGDIALCSPSLERSVVSGYICGELGIHKIPEKDKRSPKDPAWTITHIKTGTYVSAQRQPPFRTLAEAKEFAGELMKRDTWYIEGAEFGSTEHCKPERLWALGAILREVLVNDGYYIDERKYCHADKEVVRHMCSCGKIAERYIKSLDKKKKWEHKCLDCEPHDNERKD